MAKINTPKTFPKESIPDKKVGDAVQPLVDYVSQNIDQLQRALINQLTLSENLKGEIITIKAKHNQAVNITTSGNVAYAWVLKSDDGVRSFKFSNNADRTLNCLFSFESPIPLISKAQANTTGDVLGFYTCKDIGGIRSGDRASMSSFAAPGNNGDVLILGIIPAGGVYTVICFVSSQGGVVQEAKPDFSGTMEPFKNVTLFLAYA